MEDHLLVKNSLQGDQKACKALFDRYAPTMMALCNRYMIHSAEAEDALQEGFIKVFQYLGTWKKDGNLGAWIRRIMVNTCLTKLKANELKNLPFESTMDSNYKEEAIGISELSYHEIELLIESLPTGYRTVFNLVVIEGYSYPEIAQLLQITESTCRSQFFKAKKQLANQIIKLNSTINISAYEPLA
ncbi:MAG: RNA polymerase sigma factor [Saprospiraceae bacterium]|nr:RNA polymerase sigma factor [Saprospiraceae bacterium]MBK8623834.1 RNA polymerase sigma factor [Saprospiraceae bacterium]MBK9994385.1 RNA polymerase sigma factor [Saprospiraceae bacterium]